MPLFAVIVACFLLVTPSMGWALPYGDATVKDALLVAEKRLKGKKLHALLQGNWKVDVPDALKRELQVLELALDSNSTDNDFETIAPTAAERETYTGYRNLLETAPDSSEIILAHRKLEALNQNEIRFGHEKVVMRIAGAEQTQTYKVVNAHTNALQIYWIETNELNDCVFVNADTLRIFEGGQEKVRLSRL